MLLTPGKVTLPQALPWTETRSTLLPALRSAYAFPARTGTKSDESPSHAGAGRSVDSPGWMMPAQEESRRTATPPPSSGRAITAAADPTEKGRPLVPLVRSTHCPLTSVPLPVSASTAPLASSAAPRGTYAPGTVALGPSTPCASCLSTVSAVEVADNEMTPDPNAGPSAAAGAPEG